MRRAALREDGYFLLDFVDFVFAAECKQEREGERCVNARGRRRSARCIWRAPRNVRFLEVDYLDGHFLARAHVHPAQAAHDAVRHVRGSSLAPLAHAGAQPHSFTLAHPR